MSHRDATARALDEQPAAEALPRTAATSPTAAGRIAVRPPLQPKALPSTLPVEAGMRFEANARQMGRRIAAKTPRAEYQKLVAEHRALAAKVVLGEASDAEKKRLKLIRWEIDRIEDGWSGESIDLIEARAAQHKQFARDLTAFVNQLPTVRSPVPPGFLLSRGTGGSVSEEVASHIAAPEVRRVRRWVNRIAQLLALAEPEPNPDSWHRAGNCICEMCGEDYLHHAIDPRDSWLTMLCDGSRVKL